MTYDHNIFNITDVKMNGSRLLLFFSLCCLILSMLSFADNHYAQKIPLNYEILLFIGLLGAFAYGAIKEHENRNVPGMLFYYKRTRKRQALTLAMNILILPVLLYMFSLITKDQKNYEELYAYAELILLAIGVVLFGLLLWFLRSGKKFELYVTEDEFHSAHPLFKEWCFTVNPRDIKKIEHIANFYTGTVYTTIYMTMNNGELYQICKNYNYSRKNLYDSLKKANPLIEFPENIGSFKQVNSKEKVAYVEKQFPIMTKLFKWILRKK